MNLIVQYLNLNCNFSPSVYEKAEGFGIIGVSKKLEDLVGQKLRGASSRQALKKAKQSISPQL